MAGPSSNLLGELLEKVSRSFYKTLGILPHPVRGPVSLAYLLARTSDTIADTQILPTDRRLAALDALRDRAVNANPAPLDFDDLAHNQGSRAEQELLERAEDAVELLAGLSAEDQQLVRAVLSTIISGQRLDLERFAEATSGRIVALANADELDDYTYRVAGCVGEFWTRICRAKLFPRWEHDEETLLSNAIRFGKGLQLVNILRDLPSDLRQGRCYIPEDLLWAVGLAPHDLLQPENEGRFRPLFESYLSQAESYLAAGWQYTLALPVTQMRVRLACAWPTLIGVRTIDALRIGSILAPELRIKVSRAEVKGILLRSTLLYPLQPAWRGLFRRAISAPGNRVDSVPAPG